MVKFPNDELFLLMGEDMLRIFPDWYEPRRICELATLALIGRGGQEILDLSFLKGLSTRERLRQIRASRVPMPAVAIGSTEIRKRVKAGKSVKYWLPESVRKYIEKNDLY